MSTENAMQIITKVTGEPLTLGRLLWSIRKSEDLTQIKFASKLGISKQQLSDIENARKPVSPQLAAKYAEILGYCKEQFIRLSLQAMMDRYHLNYSVEVMPKSPLVNHNQL